jgi:hypothetical protein
VQKVTRKGVHLEQFIDSKITRTSESAGTKVFRLIGEFICAN